MTIKREQVDQMDKAELESLQAMVNTALSSLNIRHQAAAFAAAEKVLKEFGFTLADIPGPRSTGKSGNAGRKLSTGPKYHHPENQAVTWSGYGRRPGWFLDYTANGGDVDDLLIVKAAPVPASHDTASDADQYDDDDADQYDDDDAGEEEPEPPAPASPERETAAANAKAAAKRSKALKAESV